MHSSRATQRAAALGVLGLQQVTFSSARAQDFSAGRNLEPLGHGLLGFDTFGSSHKSINLLSKRTRNIGAAGSWSKPYFLNPNLDFK